MLCMKTDLINHCKAIYEHTAPAAQHWGGSWVSCQGGPVAHESRGYQPGQMPPPLQATTGMDMSKVEKLLCPCVIFNVVWFDCGLEPDAIFHPYEFSLLMSTKKLQILMLPVKAVLLKDLR